MNLKLVVPVSLAISLLSPSCNRRSSLPAVRSTEYRELCSSFYLGVAALQSGEDVNARNGLTHATQIAPGEPASWVDLGLLQAREQDFDAAYQSFEKARGLAPDNSRIEGFLGLVEAKRGKLPETLAHYEKAVSLDSSNLRALYSWADGDGAPTIGDQRRGRTEATGTDSENSARQ
jgi:Flp pilus assembly protein TadD